MPETSQPHLSHPRLSHFDASGQATMVDVSDKRPSRRTATASAFVELSAAVLAALPSNPKGNPLEVARFAGIQAAKRTAELIPMCHPLALTHVDVQAEIVAGGVRITAAAATVGPTGVEMEALTAAAVAALTVYDMTKALDKAIVIRNVQLEEKTGGKSGEFLRTWRARIDGRRQFAISLPVAGSASLPCSGCEPSWSWSWSSGGMTKGSGPKWPRWQVPQVTGISEFGTLDT